MLSVNIKKQSGFTLVEIAIVLVIIGLLLGGILKGQELITSARVRNLADQNTGVQAAYYGFIDRYRQVPGDMLLANAQAAISNTVTVGGDGNQIINDGSLAEAAAAWQHMALAGFIQGAYGGNAAYVATVDAPINAFQGRILLGMIDEYTLAPAEAATVRLGYVFGSNVPVNVMRELDVKIDDQEPDTGVMRMSTTAAVGAANYGGIENEGSAGACMTAVGGNNVWNINGNAQNCNAIYLY